METCSTVDFMVKGARVAAAEAEATVEAEEDIMTMQMRAVWVVVGRRW